MMFGYRFLTTQNRLSSLRYLSTCKHVCDGLKDNVVKVRNIPILQNLNKRMESTTANLLKAATNQKQFDRRFSVVFGIPYRNYLGRPYTRAFSDFSGSWRDKERAEEDIFIREQEARMRKEEAEMIERMKERNKLTMLELAKSEVKRILQEKNESVSKEAIDALAVYVVHGGFVAAQQKIIDSKNKKGEKGKETSGEYFYGEGEFNG